MTSALARAGLHAAAGAVVLVGVAAQVWRPLAPPLADLPAPSAFFPPDLLARIAAYRAPLRLVAVAALLVRVGIPILVAVTPAGRRMVARFVARIGAHRPVLAATAVVVAVVVAVDLLLLPAAFWSGYVHDTAFGLRRGGAVGWARDWAVATLPGWVGATVVTAGGWSLARRLPRAWPAVAGLLAAGLGGLVVLLSPVVLEPLQFRVYPLREGPARAVVEEVLARAGRSGDVILEADASRRTNRTNAYVSGLFGTKRVVVYDTLVASRPPAEVGLVVAHEIAHDRHDDLLRNVAFAGAGTIAAAYVLAAVLRWRAHSGRQVGHTDPHGAVVALAVVAVLGAASLPVQQLVSRRAEAAADLTALTLTGAPATFQALTVGLVASNLTDPQPPTWARLLWSSHPPAVARLEMAERWPALSQP